MDQLHKNVRQAFFRGAAVQEPGNIGMVEIGENLALILESRNDEIGVGLGANNLNRYLFAVLVIATRSAEHFSHAAHADFLDNSIVPDRAPEPMVAALRRFPSEFAGEQGFVEKLRPGLLVPR